MAELHSITLGNVHLLEVNANPDASITAEKGSLALDSTNAKLYQNTDGSTAWSELGGGGASVSDPSVIPSNQEYPSAHVIDDTTSFGTSNKIFYMPFHLNSTQTVKRIALNFRKVSASGSVDVGIYDVDGTKKVTLGSTVSTTLAAAAQRVGYADIADTSLNAGRYYMAFVSNAVSNTTSLNNWTQFEELGTDRKISSRITGLRIQTGTFPLPATATFSDPSEVAGSDGFPMMALLLEA